MKYPIEKTEQEWKEQLGLERYRILREKGTEYYVNAILLTMYDLELMVSDCKDPDVDITGIAKNPVYKEQLSQILRYYVYNEDMMPNDVKVL